MSITVTKNVTSSDIYMTASPKDITYYVVYKSSNGTDLGSKPETNKYGTENTITPPAITGYTTPAAQKVIWDSTSAKTITFTYTPTAVATSQTIIQDAWWWKRTENAGIKYTVKFEYRNRTATSVEARIVWTNTISDSIYGFHQTFTGTIGGKSIGDISIASNVEWPQNAQHISYNGSKTGDSDWITISVTATQTTVQASGTWKGGSSGDSGTWSGTLNIPAY